MSPSPKKPDITKRKLPSQARARATVDAIVQAAAHILGEDGLAALTTNRVAERAGVSIGSLYQYFPNRDAILVALAVANTERKQAALVATLAACAHEPFVVAIERALTEVGGWRGHDPKLQAEISSYLPRVTDQSEVLSFLDRSVTSVLEAFLRARADEIQLDDPAAAAFLLVHTVQPLAQRIHLLAEQDPARAQRVRGELRKMIARYLLPTTGEPRRAPSR